MVENLVLLSPWMLRYTASSNLFKEQCGITERNCVHEFCGNNPQTCENGVVFMVTHSILVFRLVKIRIVAGCGGARQ